MTARRLFALEVLDETRAAAPRLNSQLLTILEHASIKTGGSSVRGRFHRQVERWAGEEAEAVQRLGAVEAQLVESARLGGGTGRWNGLIGPIRWVLGCSTLSGEGPWLLRAWPGGRWIHLQPVPKLPILSASDTQDASLAQQLAASLRACQRGAARDGLGTPSVGQMLQACVHPLITPPLTGRTPPHTHTGPRMQLVFSRMITR